MTTSAFPNGTSLVSSALTPDSLATIIQAIVAQILGFDPVINPNGAFSAVRVSWPVDGQPAWGIDEDVCFVRATQQDNAFSRSRDETFTPGTPSIPVAMGYTQTWDVHLALYGPSCADHARLILSAFSLDWVKDLLFASNLYPLPWPGRPVYAPELFQGQWWKRADLSLEMNEQVAETTTVQQAAFASVGIVTNTGLTDEINVP
jgi:hypothetical protein